MRLLLTRWLPPAALLIALIIGWELWVAISDTPSYLVPSPGGVIGAFFDSTDVLGPHVVTTALEALAGLTIGALGGASLAALLASVPLARRVLEPLLVTSQTIPMIVLAPLLAFWFGIGYTPKILVVALITFFPVAISTAAGLRTAEQDLVDLVRSMGASRRKMLRLISFPAAVPAFFAGLRIAAAYAVAGAVIGELVAGERGLGVFINRSQASFRTDRLFVAVAIIAVLSALLFAVIGAISRIAAPWQQSYDPISALGIAQSGSSSQE